MGKIGRIIKTNDCEIVLMYENELNSIPDIAKKLNVSRSTIRLRLIENGVNLRDRFDAIRLHPEKLGTKKGRIFSENHKKNIKISKIKFYENNKPKGFSLKKNGYFEITTGEEKGTLLHVSIMQKHIGRKINKYEVVHHINEIKTDNNIENLELMTRKSHSKYHINKRNNNLKLKSND